LTGLRNQSQYRTFRRLGFFGPKNCERHRLGQIGNNLIGGQSLAAVSWLEVGCIAVHGQGERFMRGLVMRDPVEKIRLRAIWNDVFRRSVQANLADGETRDIFEALIQSNRSQVVDLPGDGYGLQSLTFQCGALVRGSAQIAVFADIGRYGDQWSSTAR
jgi:hypothetical protein